MMKRDKLGTAEWIEHPCPVNCRMVSKSKWFPNHHTFINAGKNYIADSCGTAQWLYLNIFILTLRLPPKNKNSCITLLECRARYHLLNRAGMKGNKPTCLTDDQFQIILCDNRPDWWYRMLDDLPVPGELISKINQMCIVSQVSCEQNSRT